MDKPLVVRLRRQFESPGNQAPNYASRRVQYRMLALVFSLLLVLFMMGEAAKPTNWQWLFQGQDAASQEGTEPPLEDATINTRLKNQPLASQPAGVVVIQPTTEPTVQLDDLPLFLDFDPERYQVVKDDTVFRSSESRLWYTVLAGLRDAGPRLKDQSAVTVGFTQLYSQPKQYRGRLVEVTGTVRRAHKIQARENDQGITSYVRCWLFPDGTTNPIVVYANEMPDGFPLGMSISEVVGFRGVFFKRWAYEAEGGIMTAPLVLATIDEWTPQPVVVNKPAAPKSLILPAIVLAALVSASYAWLVFRQSLKYGVPRQQVIRPLPQLETSFESLRQADIESTDETIRNQLQEREGESGP